MNKKPSLDELINALDDIDFISNEVTELYTEGKSKLSYTIKKSYLKDLKKDETIISAYVEEAPTLQKYLGRILHAVLILERISETS